MDELLSVKDLKVCYSTRRGNIFAVNGVSFCIERGETVGVLGESGCGKTTLAYSLVKLLPDSAKILHGKVMFKSEDILSLSDGALRKIRWNKISIIFQSAMNSLNPVLRVGDQIIEAILAHRDISFKEAKREVENLYDIVGLDRKFIMQYPHEYSGGMRQRAIIAMALALSPELLIADEPTTALDVLVQAQILEKLKELQKIYNLSILFISHDILVLSEVANTIMIMYAGEIVEIARKETILGFPKHPYTLGLLQAYPVPGKKKKLVPIDGEVPDLSSLPAGCAFHPRCLNKKDICIFEKPLLKNYNGHYIACHLV